MSTKKPTSKSKKAPPPSTKNSGFSWVVRITSLLLTIIIFVGFGYLYLESQLPDVAALKDVRLEVPLRVYSADGQLISEFGVRRRSLLTLDKIPKQLIEAVIATEDQRFFQHGGVDFPGLLRATVELLLTGTKSQGGSTITMQVTRSFYLTREKTFTRKFNEILLAIKIDRELSKQKILEIYLNEIYLGKRAYGVAAAAQVYYGKSLDQLTLPELAMIAGLPKAPSTLNPLVNPIAAKKRRDHVLLRMYEEGFIDSSTYKKAVETPLTATYHGESTEVKASYVAEMVRNLMIASFGADAYTKGYLVYTTIDSKLQLAADRAVRDALLAYDQRHGYRGAERNWGKFSHKETDDWQAALEKIRPVNGLKPAAVTQVENTEVFALLADGEHITIPWSGLSWARHADSEGHLGAAPKTAHDVVKVGDIIRVQNTEKKTWRLSQVPAVQGAMVSLNPQTGAITSLVGGFDYRSSSFNRVTQAERQPGSGFKPFIYAAALDRGFTLASLINDEPITFGDWEPQNFDDKYRGPTRVREGLIRSINMISIRLLDATGLNHALAFLSHFGFNTAKLPHNLSIALGSGGVTPLEMATGYAVFANGGYKVSPYIIDRVTTADGKLIYQAKPKVVCTHCDQTPAPAAGDSKLLAPKAPPAATTTATQEQYAPRAISPQVAFLMTSALKDVVRMGTAHGALVLKRNDLAGKTGTTNEEVDTWFNGFNSDIVATAWVGFDQPSSLHEYGSRAALPIWIDFMREALAGKPEHTMEEPVDIESVRIDPVSGLLARTGQSNAMFEYFLQGTEPTEVASYAESLPAPIFDATHDDAHYGHDDGELEEDPLF